MYTCGISNPFGLLSPTLGQVAHVLRDRSPLGIATPFDLHFLGTSQAFVLSQDQTLHGWLFKRLIGAKSKDTFDDVMTGYVHDP